LIGRSFGIFSPIFPLKFSSALGEGNGLKENFTEVRVSSACSFKFCRPYSSNPNADNGQFRMTQNPVFIAQKPSYEND
jgi:hypothetical protein